LAVRPSDAADAGTADDKRAVTPRRVIEETAGRKFEILTRD
jgi:hypothetical protein